MLIVKSISVGVTTTKFLSLCKENLALDYRRCNIHISLLDTVNNKSYNRLSYEDINEISRGSLTSVFGIIDSKDYVYFFEVSDLLWSFLDYVEEPIGFINQGYFNSKKDFLRYIKKDDNLVMVASGMRSDVFMDLSTNRRVIVLFARELYKSLDTNNIFWVMNGFRKFFPIPKCRTYYGEDVITVLDFYVYLLSFDLKFDENTEVYIFSNSYEFFGYKINLNKNIISFLSKLMFLRRVDKCLL